MPKRYESVQDYAGKQLQSSSSITSPDGLFSSELGGAKTQLQQKKDG